MDAASNEREKRDTLITDRGLARSGLRVHGVNPALLVEKILRERVQDGHYWHLQACNLQFYELLTECSTEVTVVGTYLNVAKTKVTKFLSLLFRLLQLPEIIDADVVKWIIIGDHGFKYLTVLFMLYARLVWEDGVLIWKVLEEKLADYRKIRVVENGVVSLSHVDELAEQLLDSDKNSFFGLSLPRLVKRWVLEENGDLEDRESEMLDAFEEQLEDEEE